MAQEIRKQQSDITRYRDPFAQMRAEMDRLFENFIGSGVFRHSGTVANYSADAEHLTYARMRRRSSSTLNYRA